MAATADDIAAAAAAALAAPAAVAKPSEKPFGISQIKAYIPVILDMTKFNYDLWRELFETHCSTFGVLEHIDGSGNPSPDIAKAWKERDGLVKMWIYGTISESLLDTVLTAKCTARDLFITIENLFRDNKEARALQLDQELRTATIGDLSVHDYCKKLKSLSDLLTNMDSPVTDCALVMYLLNGLSDKFDNIINVIKHKEPYPTFSAARSMLLLEEDRLAKQVKPQPSNTKSSSAPNVLYTESAPPQPYQSKPQPQHQGRGYSSRGHGGRHNRGRGRYNNQWQQNYAPPPWSYGPPQWPMSYGYNPYPSPAPFSPPPPYPHPYSSTPPSPSILGPAPHHRAHTEAHVAQQSPVPPQSSTPAPNEQYLPSEITNAFNTMTLQDPGASSWYMDTRATNHITADSGTLCSVFNTSASPPVKVGNGSLAPVTKLGNGHLFSGVTVQGLYMRLFTPIAPNHMLLSHPPPIAFSGIVVLAIQETSLFKHLLLLDSFILIRPI
ncbi:unnamed protein product [Microthlaspi erraticum]|uniref:Retrotransposon gag domain-containing protein n=1 Tax=Microthlaspi erraticum TaxID=1685480 RepID=A0A6D2LEC1_9BRAS|nr:unnamed protein product [Microthlaspi erraticum]